MRVPVTIIGGIMPNPPQEFTVSPRTGGSVGGPATSQPPLRIPVKPGKVVTIVATGAVSLGPNQKMPNGPDGFGNREFSKREFLLNSKFYNASQYVGALIGSFDGFSTGFVVGSNSSFIVPEKIEELSLAINDIRGQFDDNKGLGFNVTIMISDPVSLPTRVGLSGNPDLGLPGVLRAGANLPQLQIDAFRRLPTTKPRVFTVRPAGYAVYAIYQSHVRNTERPIATRGSGNREGRRRSILSASARSRN
jgi:hypothetical protein